MNRPGGESVHGHGPIACTSRGPAGEGQENEEEDGQISDFSVSHGSLDLGRLLKKGGPSGSFFWTVPGFDCSLYPKTQDHPQAAEEGVEWP